MPLTQQQMQQLASFGMDLRQTNPKLSEYDALEPGVYAGKITDLTLEQDKADSEFKSSSGFSYKLSFAAESGGSTQIFIGIDSSPSENGQRARNKVSQLLYSIGYSVEQIKAQVGAVLGNDIIGRPCYLKVQENYKKDPKTGKDKAAHYRDFVGKDWYHAHKAEEAARAAGKPPAAVGAQGQTVAQPQFNAQPVGAVAQPAQQFQAQPMQQLPPQQQLGAPPAQLGAPAPLPGFNAMPQMAPQNAAPPGLNLQAFGVPGQQQ